MGANVSVAPGQSKMVKFTIPGPEGNYTRDKLPELKISAPYITSVGIETHSLYYYHLFNPPTTVA